MDELVHYRSAGRGRDDHPRLAGQPQRAVRRPAVRSCGHALDRAAADRHRAGGGARPHRAGVLRGHGPQGDRGRRGRLGGGPRAAGDPAADQPAARNRWWPRSAGRPGPAGWASWPPPTSWWRSDGDVRVLRGPDRTDPGGDLGAGAGPGAGRRRPRTDADRCHLRRRARRRDRSGQRRRRAGRRWTPWWPGTSNDAARRADLARWPARRRCSAGASTTPTSGMRRCWSSRPRQFALRGGARRAPAPSPRSGAPAW